MCPLYPLHYLLMYPLILGPLWYLFFGAVASAAEAISSSTSSSRSPFDFNVNPEKIKKLMVDSTQTVEISFDLLELHTNSSNPAGDPAYFEVGIGDPGIAKLSQSKLWIKDAKSVDDKNKSLSFNVTGTFLGYSDVCVKTVNYNNDTGAGKCVEISVIRQPRVVDKVFTYSVAALVMVMYINMGAALDLKTIKETIRRPYGPAIGIFCQFVIMPLLSYGIAKAFIQRPALQLGLFITGCSPGGGASNVWTLALGGNLDLSVTMTTFSSFAAFAMMPFWIFTLGSTIFSAASLAVPYSKIGTFAISLVVPLAIGIGIQLKWPKLAKFLVRILKPFAIFLIVFIVVFAIYTNLFLLQLLTWEIILCGMLLPWLGYLLGGGLAILLRREWKDVIAIAIETGVQNTGLSIFALRFSLAQPEADLTTVLPVAVAIMTPVIPTFVLAMQKLHNRIVRNSGFALTDKEDSISPSITPSV